MQYVMKRFKEEYRIENKVRKGLLTKLIKQDKIFINREFVKQPRLSAVKVTVEFNEKLFSSVSSETV